MEDVSSNDNAVSGSSQDHEGHDTGAAAPAAITDNKDEEDSSEGDSDYQSGQDGDSDNSSDDYARVNKGSAIDRMATLDQIYASDGSTLILDVGVSLPGSEEDELPGSYRKQWRDGFRFRILPM